MLTIVALKLLVGCAAIAAWHGDTLTALFASAVALHYVKELID